MSVAVYGTQRLVNALFDARAVGFKRGKVIKFASGILSPGAYINNRNLASYPQAWDAVLTAMLAVARRLRPQYDIIAGVATGGIAHGSVIARELRVPYMSVKKGEKSHGLGGRIDGDAQLLSTGAGVLVVEDMGSTFESSLSAIGALTHEGAVVRHTLLINSWNFPEFQCNSASHSVYVGCLGKTLLEEAMRRALIDEKYAKLVHDWLEHPDDQSWVHDGTWEFPVSKGA
jgi:orotate phosphoribosyltransferase